MSFLAYRPAGPNAPLLSDWTPVSIADQFAGGGFDAQVFAKDGKAVIAFRGTDFPESLVAVPGGFEDFWYGKIDGADSSYAQQIMRAILVVARERIAQLASAYAGELN
jgi:hypothetical protein